ncbi:hypothetical protein E5J99_10640 [Hymenobacter elongatus]|uniref:Uncharacterized protein n=1 Tax=Hymenobacter elongatus TaxID=877208 RepID=A0A4Z0PLA4_9BACT|nr:hypothetical protein E5J99_10640 [Hymenobacter elongatus]
MLLLALVSCSRKEDISPKNGTVIGSISPAGAATGLTLTATDGKVYTATPDALTGSFTVAQLPLGNYSITTTPAVGYTIPAPVSVAVSATSTTVAPIKLSRDGIIRGSMTWTVGGTTFTASRFYGELSNTIVSIVGATQLNGAWHEVALVIPMKDQAGNLVFKGVGTYILGTGEYPFGKYVDNTNSGNATYSTWLANKPVGTVVVTSYNDVNRTIGGTFEFEAAANLNTTGSVTVSKGSFNFQF